jgi:hypothetical protein
MSFELRGAAGALNLDCRTWRSVLRLAHRGGWQPAGALHDEKLYGAFICDFETAEQLEPVGFGETCRALHESEAFCGLYVADEKQTVAAGDAAALADGLERVLARVPQRLGRVRDVIRSIVAFCRAGEFSIG